MSTNPFSESASTASNGAVGASEAAGPEGTAQRYTNWLVMALVLGLLLRLFILRFPYMFTLDVNTFRAWTDTIVKVGPANFYASTWSDYPPVFMYFLWIWGHIQQVFTGSSMPGVVWTKLPGCLADIINGFLIFQLLKGRVAIRSAFRTAVFYVFNPVVIFVSAVWGQVDAVITMMMLLVSLTVLLNWLIPAAVLTATSVLVKPQGLFMIPVVFFSMWFRQPVKKWPVAIGAALGVVYLLLLPATWNKLGGMVTTAIGPMPAFLLQPFFWFTQQMQQTGENYKYSTVNAFNIWMLPPPNEPWKPDDRILFFLPHHTWGLILVVALLALVGWYLFKKRHEFNAYHYFLSASVVLTGYYMLATRMHERYIFPALAFLALAAAFNRRMAWIYWGFTLTSFISIAYVFYFYNDESAWVEGLKAMFANGPMIGNLKLSGMVLLSLVNVWLFGELLSFLFARGDLLQEVSEHPIVRQFRTIAATVKKQAIAWADYAIPAGIALVFIAFGAWRLGIPSEQIFDEVYHARTAMEYIAGVNPYEWTHPPLAKLIAALSILIFGGQFALEAKEWTEHMAFAWRFSSLVFGAGTLVVCYALARSMFENRAIATAATLILAVDGVFFVQSRVAMTNIYEVFFILLGTLGTWLYIKRDASPWLLLTGFGLGCALATRWSSLYAWGLTGLLLLWHVWSVKRQQWGAVPAPEAATPVAKVQTALAGLNKGALLRWLGLLALTMGLIPVIVYLATYIPFVLQGTGAWQLKLFNWNWHDHGWGKVISQQKDMWNYHSGLSATHPYSSPWWSWPLMLRPTWYYFHDFKNGTIGGIWAIGNAFIWWASVPALAYVAFLAWRDKLKSLGLLALMGFGLWIMWGVQPRPLLYMHYMFESIPFVAIALAYIGYQFWWGQSEVAEGESPAIKQKALRGIIIAYGVLLVAWFVFYYPLLSGMPVPWPFYQMHIWFGKSWI